MCLVLEEFLMQDDKFYIPTQPELITPQNLEVVLQRIAFLIW